MGQENFLSVLVADDEPELLNAVCQLIDWEDVGFRLVGRAGNGLDALQLIEELQPDFLLTDIRMPFISGTKLVQQAKAVQPLLQAAFLSGYDDFEYAQQGIEEEIAAYLLKPISMSELTQELRKIHAKVQKRLELLRGGTGGESRQLAAAMLLLDDYAGQNPEACLKRVRELGMELSDRDAVKAVAVSAQGFGAETQALLGMAERVLGRAYACCGFLSGDRAALLLASKEGFSRLYPAVDELRQLIRRTWGAEALIGLSKDFPSPGFSHAAYQEAVQALQLAQKNGGLCAADEADSMDVLCARALKMLESEYMDESLTLQGVSERLHVSANYLGSNIKKYAGDSFMNLLIRKRMSVAERLIKSGGSRISDVARRCGYSDQSYFGYCFKKYYGISPVRARQEAERGQGQA